MTTYHQEVILAMELNRSHIGKLVQMITDSWSMTGTLQRVDQHDNREWEIAYPSRQLVPVRGEIYTTLHIGPWVGDVIGNQPVTVETVKGTLEAPETATRALPHLITEEESAEARAKVRRGYYPEGMGEDPPAIEGTVMEPDPIHGLVEPNWAFCGRKVRSVNPGLLTTENLTEVTCPDCLREIKAHGELPPEPPAYWGRRKTAPRTRTQWAKPGDPEHAHQWVLDPHVGYSCICGGERPLDYRGEYQ